MNNQLIQSCDAILEKSVSGIKRVPGVVAMLTDRTDTIYEGARGVRSLTTGTPMSMDTVFAQFSTTKAIAGTAVLQCMEEGLLDLDAPAKRYVPAIGDIQVIEGFDASGAPRLRAPKAEITTRMLMLHTAGFGYEIFNETYKRLVDQDISPIIVSGTKAALNRPLLFDPGTKWEYGISMDWAGQVVEAIRGQRLGDVLRERVFAPLGMTDMAFTRDDGMKARTASVHARGEDGSLTAMDDFALPDNPEVDMAGHGLYGTVPDYMKFIRMWLNNGAGPQGRVLKPETVAAALRNGLEPHQKVVMLPGAMADFSHDAEFFPGLKKSWSYTFMVNDEPAPTGRPAGANGWAGLANLFFWIDHQNGLGGFWATQILPFGDATSFLAYFGFETAAYAAGVSSGR